MSETFYGDLKGGCGTLIMVFCTAFLGIGGYFVGCVQDNRHEEVMNDFRKGNFETIHVREQDETARGRIVEAVKPNLDLQTVISRSREKSIIRETYDELFVSPLVRVDGLPSPMYIKRFTPIGESFGSTKDPFYGVTYAIFKGPNTLQKFRAWAKENKYEEWDFELKPRRSYRNDYSAIPVHVKKEGSELSIQGFFQSSAGLYSWHADGPILRCFESTLSHGYDAGGATHLEEDRKLAK